MKKTAQFQTPHEQKKSKTAKAKKETKSVGRDAFGGRLGTRMSAINLVVINAGKKGATVHEVAKKTKESTGLISAQLGWIVSSKKQATRKEESLEGGKKTFRYFAKSTATNT
jgi:hypothetical protein